MMNKPQQERKNTENGKGSHQVALHKNVLLSHEQPNIFVSKEGT